MKHLYIITLMLAALGGYAQDEEISPTRTQNIAAVEKIHQENLKKYARNPTFLVRPGLLANRKKRTVTILAEATGVEKNKIVEFFIIYKTSGHDYEALAVSFAKPSDVHQALEFIGINPGRPADPKNYIFWPKGERIFMTINGTQAEKFILGHETGQPLSRRGLVFTGSQMVPSRAVLAKKVYAADEREPSSIASNYNEPYSVLDVPRRAPQKTVYGDNIMNPALVMPEGKFLEIQLAPEYKDGRKRVRDLIVELIGDEQIHISEGSDKRDVPVIDAMQYLEKLLKDGCDPFVRIRTGNAATLIAAHKFSRAVSLLETDDGIRIEEPEEGQLYYLAFSPPERFLNRKERLSHPIELTLTRNETTLTGSLKHFTQIWKDDELYPLFETTDYPVNSPSEMRSVLDKVTRDLPAILVFAPQDLTYGELMDFVKPALLTHPLIHVFVEGTYSNPD